MNRNTFLVWIFVCYWSCTVYTVNGVYTDCERPPPVLHGKSDLSVDYDGTIVTALYKCDAGYRLHGESQLTCDTDTDEWLGDLPACQLETGSNSTVSEIEQGMIGVIGTVAPGLTHEEFIEPVEQPTTKGPNTNEIEAPPSQAPALDSEQHVEHVETSEHESAPQTEAPTNALKKRKGHRKGKKPEFQEDNTIDADFASRLDMSCIDGVTAPSVSDAHIVEYIRAKKDEYKFLVAIYGCDEDYYLENPQSNRLYCSQGIWVGNYPVCVMKEGDVDYGTDSDDDNQNENSDSIKTDTENTATNSVQQNNENINTETVEKNVTPNEPISVASTNDNSNVDEQIITNEIIPQTKEETINVIPNEIEKPTPTSNSCDVNNGGCEQICNMVPDDDIGANVPECSCNIGFYLDQMDGVKCLDINECEYPSICPNECENTMGSYRCLDDVEIIPTTVNVLSSTEFNAPVKACGDGLRLDESNNCIDIDECAEGNTGCEYCQNSVGGYQCTCPDGFVLKDDEKTCRDIDECTTFADYEYEENTPTARTICSHQCINTVGSYLCVCPNNFHLGDDKRTCEQDFCRHLNDIAANKTKCSHDCVDDVHGYQCKCPDGATLDADMKTCIFLDACSISGDRCLPGKCVNIDSESFKCECPSGFAEHNQRCVDYDECAIGTHQCSHKCMNTDGSYLCECPDGLILSNDQHTCVAADICAADNGGCSDICNFVNEKVICSCLDDAELDTDGKTCRKKNICAENNGGCQQVCDDKMNRCECFPGFETFDDAKTCHDANECLQNNGGCPQQCVNTEGEFECTCFDGFEKDEGTGNCIDKNECDVNNGNCDHECINTQGSYQCTCRSGYSLSADQHQCVDINECEIDNGKCSDTCVNLQGSYLCSCPEGYKLDNDKVTCVEVKDSCLALAAPEHGNVRCSRSRHSSQSFHRTKCSFWCKDGFTLMGPSVKYCNSTDGQWDTTEISCVQSACPPLQVIQPGTMSDDCLNGRMYPGQSCALICPQGFKSAAPGITQCLPNRQWTKTDLRCEPIQHHVQTQHYASQGNQQPNHNQNYGQNHGQKSAQNSGQNHLENHGQNGQNGKPKIKTVIKGGETHHVGHIKLGETTQSSSSTQNIVRPYIKCPQDTVISLPKNQKFIHIKLEQPKSNVNWAYIEANPKWAKNLQAHLAAGQHIITFTAHSPNSASITETCRTILTVKPVNGVTFVPAVPASILGPKVSFCPPTQDVQLQPHELKRPIYWREPAFQAGTVRLKQIFKSHLPGTTFGVGQHRITYIATDVQNQNGTCQFTIVVRPAARAQLNAPYVNGPQINNLNDHDTYLLCKGQPDMKLDTSFPRAIPPGCIIKNVRKNRPLQYNPHRRRHAFSASKCLIQRIFCIEIYDLFLFCLF
ncbi:fibrillin-2 isoform X4 [Contarinia nasturtii]|uniref:fibrillin-2 isoform X4 n=1 Tax=Contarinia nasturtii TaxID=265458 RepID=UPI0012D3DDE2|nr:fibrillin-2 isoform X4 [Contarinia nasturtii]